jgi:hypothetical protein
MSRKEHRSSLFERSLTIRQQRKLHLMVATGVATDEAASGDSVMRIVNHCGQVTKGVWWMSWRQEAMKGVLGCDKLGGVVK